MWLIILTGWRRSEVLGLRWSEIDLPRRTARLADTKTGASLRPLSELACAVIQSQPRNPVPTEDRRCGVRQSIRRDADRRLSQDVVEDLPKLDDLPADITPHVLRHSFASLRRRSRYIEPTIASLLGHKTHSITSRDMHSADAVLLAAADAVANDTMKLMARYQPQPQLRNQQRDGSVVREGFSRYPTSATASAVSPLERFTSLLTALCEIRAGCGRRASTRSIVSDESQIYS